MVRVCKRVLVWLLVGTWICAVGSNKWCFPWHSARCWLFPSPSFPKQLRPSVASGQMSVFYLFFVLLFVYCIPVRLFQLERTAGTKWAAGCAVFLLSKLTWQTAALVVKVRGADLRPQVTHLNPRGQKELFVKSKLFHSPNFISCLNAIWQDSATIDKRCSSPNFIWKKPNLTANFWGNGSWFILRISKCRALMLHNLCYIVRLYFSQDMRKLLSLREKVS